MSAGDLRNTIVTPYLEHEMVPEKNLIWCATFQMAWDRLKEFGGGPIETAPGSTIVTMLNQGQAKANDLPDTGALSAAGLLGEGIVEDIRARMRQLPGAPQPTLLPDPAGLPPDAVVFYAYLDQSLRFQAPFSPQGSLPFADGEKKVRYFGIDGYSPSANEQRARAGQVRIIWHHFDVRLVTPQDFIVELLPVNREYRLVLASIQPGATLAATVEGVMQRLRKPNTKTAKDGVATELKQLEDIPVDESGPERLKKMLNSVSEYSCLLVDEDLYIPCIRFDLAKRYDDLIGLTVTSGNEKVKGKPIFEAQQNIRFGLDEKGAELESEAVGGLFGSMAMREFSFMRPFLVLLLRQGAERPYFAMWVANPELLVPAELDPAPAATSRAPVPQ